METRQFHIEIHGKLPGSAQEVRPDTLSVTDLLELLKPVEEALALTAGDVDLGDGAVLSLVGTAKAGSVVIGVQVPEAVHPAAIALTSALQTGDWRRVPIEAQDKLHALSRRVERRRWRVRVEPNGCAGLVPVEISLEHPVPAPTVPSQVRELTTIYGALLVVGGVDETKFGRLRLLDGRIIPLALNEVLAKELAPRLFEQVSLEGVATWDTVRSQVVGFEARRVGRYAAKSATEAFQTLRDRVEGAFDEDDPLEYQRRIREGGPR